ncbi:hypothetical protein SERLA73DRAFT_27072, partial [Serpula lacrymans var. lacrymans S7.3]
HFSNGVSYMRQMTGCKHRDIQRTIACATAGAAPPGFICTICALVDFIYQAQAPVYTKKTIQAMVSSLQEFHCKKQAVLDAGGHHGTKGNILNHFQIPKLKLFQHFASSIKS